MDEIKYLIKKTDFDHLGYYFEGENGPKILIKFHQVH